MQTTAQALRHDPQSSAPTPLRLVAASGAVKRRNMDERRVADYLAGDGAVFREIDSWIRREVFKRFSSLRNEQEDLGQSVHWRLLIKLREGAFNYRSTLRSYVSGITYHVAMDRLREVYRDRTVPTEHDPEIAPSAETPYLALSQPEASRLVNQVFENAQPACRTLWRMVFVERWTYAEAARYLSIPPGTVKSRVWHGRKRALALVEERATANPPARMAGAR